MKKFFAVLVATVMIVALFAVPANAAQTVDVDDVTVVGCSFDDIQWLANCTAVRQSAAAAGVTDLNGWYAGFGANGLTQSGASILSSFDALGFRGWIGFEQEIAMFGYQIDDDAPVFDIFNGAYIEETEEAVKAAGGQYARRYNVVVPLVKGGVYTLCVVAKLADGTIVKLNSAKNPNAHVEFKANNSDNVSFKPVDKVINYDESLQVGMSLDHIFWNFNDLGGRDATEVYAEEDGSLDAVKYSGISIGYSGWVDFHQPVIGFGYMRNDEIVLAPGFLDGNEDTLEPTIRSWGGDWESKGHIQRFCVYVPIQDLTGDNYICAVAQLEDGTVVKLNSTEIHNRDTSFTIKCLPAPEETTVEPGTEPETEPATQPATQPETVPQTGDAEVAMFAVIAVLAMGAAVVFVKKRAF